MRVEVNIEADLLREVVALADVDNVTLSSLIEEGLRLLLRQQKVSGSLRTKVDLMVSRASGGVRPGVKLDNNAALLDLMDGIEPEPKEDRSQES